MSSRAEHYTTAERYLELAAQMTPGDYDRQLLALLGIGHAVLATAGRLDSGASLPMVFGGEQGFTSEQ